MPLFTQISVLFLLENMISLSKKKKKNTKILSAACRLRTVVSSHTFFFFEFSTMLFGQYILTIICLKKKEKICQLYWAIAFAYFFKSHTYFMLQETTAHSLQGTERIFVFLFF